MLTFKFMQRHDICDMMFMLKYFVSNDCICVKRHLLVHMTLQNALGVMDNNMDLLPYLFIMKHEVL